MKNAGCVLLLASLAGLIILFKTIGFSNLQTFGALVASVIIYDLINGKLAGRRHAKKIAEIKERTGFERIGPIDPDFMRNRTRSGNSKKWGYEIWGPVNPPIQLGIHGTAVAIDHDACIADGACIDVCEVNVFEWVSTPGHPLGENKSIPARENVCTFCTACKSVCPVIAIKITQP